MMSIGPAPMGVSPENGRDYPPGNRRAGRARINSEIMVTATTARPVGDMLRDWRRRRRLSQLELSNEAGVSTRHLSFVETGRSRPSRDMVLRLTERLDVP